MPDLSKVWMEGYIAADNGRSEEENPYPPGISEATIRSVEKMDNKSLITHLEANRRAAQNYMDMAEQSMNICKYMEKVAIERGLWVDPDE